MAVLIPGAAVERDSDNTASGRIGAGSRDQAPWESATEARPVEL